MSSFRSARNRSMSARSGRPRTAGMAPPSRTLAEDNMGGFMFNAGREPHAPDVNQPQRIELPVYFNTPRRYTGRQPYPPRSRPATSNNRARSLLTVANKNDVDIGKRTTVVKRLKDYEILAFACKRAGKARDEGRAYYSTGVLYDNIGNYRKAVTHYDKFLKVCIAIGDSHGEALAYNCMGVDFHKMAEAEPEN